VLAALSLTAAVSAADLRAVPWRNFSQHQIRTATSTIAAAIGHRQRVLKGTGPRADAPPASSGKRALLMAKATTCERVAQTSVRRARRKAADPCYGLPAQAVKRVPPPRPARSAGEQDCAAKSPCSLTVTGFPSAIPAVKRASRNHALLVDRVC